jgi:hypothetical protein
VIRRGDEFRIGPIRIPVLGNSDGRCSVIAIYGGGGALGMGGSIDEEILDKLAEEEGVVVNRATRKSDK